MQVIKDSMIQFDTAPRAMTPETMRQDFEYEMAQRMTRSLYENGLISVDELHRILALNKEKFSPFYKDLM